MSKLNFFVDALRFFFSSRTRSKSLKSEEKTGCYTSQARVKHFAIPLDKDEDILWNSWISRILVTNPPNSTNSTISENSTISTIFTISTVYGLLLLRQPSKSSEPEEKSWLLQLGDTRDALCRSTRQRRG